jgi:hypothetical protein
VWGIASVDGCGFVGVVARGGSGCCGFAGARSGLRWLAGFLGGGSPVVGCDLCGL